ncbi:MAG: hypothetical protein KDE26_32350, partial [Bacteroidetes bacterium]|nr:hypothetical protein [Bacteroidota bacterium]
MKFLIFIFLLLPCSLFGQLKGEYIFWGGEFSTTFTFGKNGRFHYDYTNDTNGESGRGTYKIEKDTLILTYEAYLDSGEFDCGRIVVEKGDWS